MSLAAPIGKSSAARFVTPDLVSLGLIRAPNANLKLGGNTTANSAATYLNVNSNTDDVHLTEPSAYKIWLDTATTVTAPFSATGGFSTGSGDMSVGGNFVVAGTTTVAAVTSSGTIQASSMVSTGPSTLDSVAVTTTASIADLSVGSSGMFHGTLAVSCASTLSSASISGPLTVSGACTLSAVNASGAATLGSTLRATGTTTLHRPATVNNALSVTGAEE